ncbi:hypothetical protein H8R23_01385 [Flavobacterium sp. F-380]|uniref:Uncharacterized protein n=1 Tax=Flavobacterium kayseriense TaxID=2764714 RepID=A0ABR7J3B0_9FLAO|nr:hypothetical protein [Flavobacterium kayseriense]MBC5840044.1 hypothetical protein [Flavobacterium kayseriense]MBC5847286.1 hypothetical protein [Flavobacterium kayseriense]
MKGKIRIGSKASFWNRRHELFLNGESVGNLDCKNLQIALQANTGSNKLAVKSKTFEKVLDLNITNENLIHPIEIIENWKENNSEFKNHKVIKGLTIGFVLTYALGIAYLTIFKSKELTYSILIPFLFLIALRSSFKKTYSFDLELKKF